MIAYPDRVKFTTTTTGTGTVTVDSAVAGFRTPATAISDGDMVDGDILPYTILDANGTAWECGWGAYTASGTTQARTTVVSSSDGGTAINLSAGTHTVFIGLHGHAARNLPVYVPGGRLTLTSGTPVTTADVTGATNIYYTPYIHDHIQLWDGAYWLDAVFTEKTLALGTIVKNACYDIFGYLSGGTLALEKLEWKTADFTITIASPGVVTWTAHGLENGDGVSFTTTGALPTGLAVDTVYYVVNKATDTFQLAANYGGAAINTSGTQSGTHTAHCTTKRGTDVTYQDGRLCKSGDKTRRLLGSFQASSTTATESSMAARLLQNAFNPVPMPMHKADSTASWNYTTNTWRPLNNSVANRIRFMCAVPSYVEAEFLIFGYNTAAAGMQKALRIDDTIYASNSEIGPGNSIQTYSYTSLSGSNSATEKSQARGMFLGAHFMQACEWSGVSGTTTVFGGLDKTGINGTCWG